VLNESKVVGWTVLLADQDVVGAAIPAARPVFVGPAQTQRQIERRLGKPSLQWRFQQNLSGKPVEIASESTDAVLTRQLHLPAHDI
jgi:hypothetical protein